MQIGELAQATGLTREALRFYEQQGLIQSQRQSNGYRHYAPEMAMLVSYIRTAQQLGFTLADIRSNLQPLQGIANPVNEVAQVLNQKIEQIDRRIADLQKLRDELAQRVVQDCPLGREAVTLPKQLERASSSPNHRVRVALASSL